jgi:phage baseplate assembly protein W
MPMISSFRGYSSIGTSFLSPVRYDLDLAKQDLLNHFGTRKGERVMMPTFGSIIWELLFDPLDEETKKKINDDVVSIIKNDPRWQLLTVDIDEEPNALNVKVEVLYLPADEKVQLPLVYDKGTETE